jgi:hypothetical protein
MGGVIGLINDFKVISKSVSTTIFFVVERFRDLGLTKTVSLPRFVYQMEDDWSPVP